MCCAICQAVLIAGSVFIIFYSYLTYIEVISDDEKLYRWDSS